MTLSPSRIFGSMGQLGAASKAAVPWYLSGGIAAANCVAAYQPKGAANYAASKINLANPGTYNATDGAAYPTWDTTIGWTGNGITQYLSTGVLPASGYSLIARYSNVSLIHYPACAAIGHLNTNQRFYVIAKAEAVDIHVYGYGNHTYLQGGVAPKTSSGVMAITPTKGYLNGISEFDSSIYTFVGAATSDISLLARHNVATGTQDQYLNGTLVAAAIYNIDIASYVASLTVAMAAL